MPGGMYLTWLVDQIAPFDFTRRRPRSCSLMQALAEPRVPAVAAGRMFGRRLGHPAAARALPLHGVLASQIAVWWAAGDPGQLPFQIAFFWAMASQRHLPADPTAAVTLVVAIAWVVGRPGLLREDAPGHRRDRHRHASPTSPPGSPRERIAHAVARYRVSILVDASSLGVGVPRRLRPLRPQLRPRGRRQRPDRPTADVHGAATPGGPASSVVPCAGTSTARAPALVRATVDAARRWSAWPCIVLVLREIRRSRTGRLRACCCPASSWSATSLLVVAGRASLVGAADRARVPLPGRARPRSPRWRSPARRCRSSVPSSRSSRAGQRAARPAARRVGARLRGRGGARASCLDRRLRRPLASTPPGADYFANLLADAATAPGTPSRWSTPCRARPSSCGRSATPTTCSATCFAPLDPQPRLRRPGRTDHLTPSAPTVTLGQLDVTPDAARRCPAETAGCGYRVGARSP